MFTVFLACPVDFLFARVFTRFGGKTRPECLRLVVASREGLPGALVWAPAAIDRSVEGGLGVVVIPSALGIGAILSGLVGALLGGSAR